MGIRATVGSMCLVIMVGAACTDSGLERRQAEVAQSSRAVMPFDLDATTHVFEKLDDCGVVQALVRITPGISLHIPWDEPESPGELKAYAAARGLHVDSMNSNTFQDQPGQALSYKFGSLTNSDPAVRRQADHR